MRRNRKNNLVLIFVVLLSVIGLGYALLSTTLSINGTTNVSSASWNIYWDNIVLGSNNVTDITTPATISTGKTEVSFNVNFKEPGDTYEFTVDAVNDGSIDGMVNVVTNGVYASNGTTPKTLPAYLEYTVTYSDGIAIEPNQLLKSGEREKYKVRVHYKEDITASQLPSTADNYVFKFEVTYVQADENAVTRPVPSFADDDWPTVIARLKSGDISPYSVGDEKEVDLGTLGKHRIRIANTTTPAECGAAGFSQTACGVVLEFSDIITTHVMNSTSTNVGGWQASSMRTYVNNDIYNALPEVLRNAIIDTTVVSGHGSTAGETNFTSTDKLYLLSTHEVWEDVDGNTSIGIDNRDTAYANTRQLDYYQSQNVTTGSYSGAIKQYNGSNSWWCLRSANSYSANTFFIVNSNGDWNNNFAYDPGGVSPAFRIA